VKGKLNRCKFRAECDAHFKVGMTLGLDFTILAKKTLIY